MQEHCACPDTTWHCELAPQGGGLQGLGGSGDGLPSSTTGLGTGLGIMRQPVKGSPVYPDGQTQMGLWPTTRHSESLPQAPSQGFWHLRLRQAWDGLHSELETHSGRHSGGTPK